MTRLAGFLMVLIFASPSFAQGIPCEKKEVEELRAMDRETLGMTYCDLKSRSNANEETIRSIEDFAFMEDAENCANELLKAERVYMDRFDNELPNCGN
jgi:hypothetical protein